MKAAIARGDDTEPKMEEYPSIYTIQVCEQFRAQQLRYKKQYYELRARHPELPETNAERSLRRDWERNFPSGCGWEHIDPVKHPRIKIKKH